MNQSSKTLPEYAPTDEVECAWCADVESFAVAVRAGWIVQLEGGVPVSWTCPLDQDPEDEAEAAVNEAMIEYGVDAQGRVVSRGPDTPDAGVS